MPTGTLTQVEKTTKQYKSRDGEQTGEFTRVVIQKPPFKGQEQKPVSFNIAPWEADKFDIPEEGSEIDYKSELNPKTGYRDLVFLAPKGTGTPPPTKSAPTPANNTGGGSNYGQDKDDKITRMNTLNRGLDLAIATAKKGASAVQIMGEAMTHSETFFKYVTTGKPTFSGTNDNQSDDE